MKELRMPTMILPWPFVIVPFVVFCAPPFTFLSHSLEDQRLPIEILFLCR